MASVFGFKFALDDFQVKPPPRQKIVTTNSLHGYRKYPNLINDMVVETPNHVWASDITYVTLSGGDVCYLSLITDHYSRKIVGWAVGETLETKYCLQALDMALAACGEDIPQRLIHHSDRGVQYCSYAYVEKLMSFGIQISMSKPGTPKENAIAERVNGILKNEWLKDNPPRDIDDCGKTLERIIKFYNEERPHMSIGNKTPSQAHLESGPQKRLWKNSWDQPKDSSDNPAPLCASQGQCKWAEPTLDRRSLPGRTAPADTGVQETVEPPGIVR